jgi:hypothetical protein
MIAVEIGDIIASRATVLFEPVLRGGMRREVRAVDLRAGLVGPA